MQYRFLGKARLKVSAIGFGCPTFQGKLSDADAKRASRIIDRAIDLGVNFIDTVINDGNNEQLLAKALKGKRDRVVATSKFGKSPRPTVAVGERGEMSTDGRSTWRKSVRGVATRLQTDYIDLYYLHRVDPKVPIEDTIGAMSKLVEEGNC